MVADSDTHRTQTFSANHVRSLRIIPMPVDDQLTCFYLGHELFFTVYSDLPLSVYVIGGGSTEC